MLRWIAWIAWRQYFRKRGAGGGLAAKELILLRQGSGVTRGTQSPGTSSKRVIDHGLHRFTSGVAPPRSYAGQADGIFPRIRLHRGYGATIGFEKGFPAHSKFPLKKWFRPCSREFRSGRIPRHWRRRVEADRQDSRAGQPETLRCGH